MKIDSKDQVRHSNRAENISCSDGFHHIVSEQFVRAEQLKLKFLCPKVVFLGSKPRGVYIVPVLQWRGESRTRRFTNASGTSETRLQRAQESSSCSASLALLESGHHCGSHNSMAIMVDRTITIDAGLLSWGVDSACRCWQCLTWSVARSKQ